MIVKGHEGHVICHMSSVSTAFKVHYNQKLGDPFGHLGGECTMASGGIDAPVIPLLLYALVRKVRSFKLSGLLKKLQPTIAVC